MKFLFLLSTAALSLTTLTGCLKTRNEVRETDQRQVMQQQVVTLQKTNAESGSRVGDLEQQMRELNGRVDVVENQMGKGSAGVENALKTSHTQNQELVQRVALLQEALTKMERDILTLNAEIQGLKAEKISAQANRAAEETKAAARKDTYEVGQENFTKKNWKQAILNFQKYRDEYPKGGKFADATYKIGVSFQELGMKDEAKTFYEEVVTKFPKSDEARRCRIRLKNLLKK